LEDIEEVIDLHVVADDGEWIEWEIPNKEDFAFAPLWGEFDGDEVLEG
jgi:hypothetical protein